MNSYKMKNMRLSDQIISILNAEDDFLSGSAKNLGESRDNIKKAFSEIVSAAVNVIFIQCILNQRSEEICRMAQDCSLVNPKRNQFLTHSPISIKGSGANSELFSDRFGSVVEVIARNTEIKSGSVKKLFSVLTPMVLSNIYFKYKAFGFTMGQLAIFLEKEARRNKTTREITLELAALIKNEKNEAGPKKAKPVSFVSRVLNLVGISGNTIPTVNH